MYLWNEPEYSEKTTAANQPSNQLQEVSLLQGKKLLAYL
jgi:hypothetical protein